MKIDHSVMKFDWNSTEKTYNLVAKVKSIWKETVVVILCFVPRERDLFLYRAWYQRSYTCFKMLSTREICYHAIWKKAIAVATLSQILPECLLIFLFRSKKRSGKDKCRIDFLVFEPGKRDGRISHWLRKGLRPFCVTKKSEEITPNQQIHHETRSVSPHFNKANNNLHMV